MSKLSSKFLSFSDNFNITKKRMIFFLIPVVVILVMIIAFAAFAITGGAFSKGINLSLDFTGGTSVSVKLDNLDNNDVFNAESAKIVKIINDAGYACSEPQLSGSGLDAAIYIKYQNENDNIGTTNAQIVEKIEELYPDLVFGEDITVDAISSSAATRLVKEALIAIAVIWAVIFVYILIRFELWSGLAALIGLIHDVIMMVCFTIICHIEVNITYVAAIITIIAYSINNTIIVFDRVREHVKMAPLDLKSNTVEFVVNKSTGEMLGRSIGTTVTTLIPIILLACIGSSSLQVFALPIMFGLLAGTYSSIFISPNLYVLFKGARVKKLATGYVGAVKTTEGGTPVATATDKAKAKKANTSKVYKKYKKK